jgi:hypothetical protein
MARGTYEVKGSRQTVSTAVTILEVTAPATAILKLIRAYVNQNNIVAITQGSIQILRKTVSITGTASPPTPAPLGSEAASGATVKWVATVEGTDGTVLQDKSFNYQNGYEWVAASEVEKYRVPPSGIIALKFPVAPASAVWTFGMVFEEDS